MLNPGDLVTVDFPGVTGLKRRPAVVVSSHDYHGLRPDVIVAIVTSQISDATTAMDYILQDWSREGLRRPSAFRAFLVTLPARSATPIGRCSDRAWKEIRDRLARAIAITS